MKSKNIILLVVVIAVIAIVFYSVQGNQSDPAYAEEIRKEREEKDHFMRASAESPFASKPETFKKLNYFDADPSYRIAAELTPVKNKKIVVLGTSDGKEQRYIEYAYATFRMGGVDNKLLILEVIDMGPFRGKLFLAFGDKTSGGDTYGGGRYLDIVKVPGATSITLDFNKAYNPYCAYDNSFSCPLPPPENILEVAIRAGEKNYDSSEGH